jgi:hypothetical protein
MRRAQGKRWLRSSRGAAYYVVTQVSVRDLAFYWTGDALFLGRDWPSGRGLNMDMLTTIKSQYLPIYPRVTFAKDFSLLTIWLKYHHRLGMGGD